MDAKKTMTLKEFKHYFTEKLTNLYPKAEVDSFFFWLIEERLNLKRIDAVLKPNFEISTKKLARLKKDIFRLLKEEPIQYILGKTEFLGLSFLVDKNTLIPRPETEELVDWILNELTENGIQKTDSNSTFLDIGTGTGCIAICLSKNLKTKGVYAIDISGEALKIAKQNAALNNVDVHFFETDILNSNSLNTIAIKAKHYTNNIEIISPQTIQNNIKFDVIVSNPPYVRELEKVTIKNNVLQNEPHLALFVSNENPLLFYDKIADLAKLHLSKKGILFFEINQYLGKEMVELLTLKGFTNIELKKDIFENDRMIKAQLN